MIREAFRHHAWATRQLLDHCAGLPPEMLGRRVDGVYGTVLETLRHIVDADAGYLWVVSGGELGELIEDDSVLSFDDVVALADRNAAQWEQVLERNLDPDIDVTFTDDEGNIRHATLGVRLAQVPHHGSDHRSQICTTLSLLGRPAEEYDVWAWAEVEGLRRVQPPAL